MFRHLFHYVDKQSCIHRMDPRVKFLMLVPILLVTMTSGEFSTLLFIFSLVIFLYILSRIPFHRYKAIISIGLISSFSLIFIGTFFYWGFYHYPERQVTIWLWVFRPEDSGALPILGPIIMALTYGRGIVVCKEGFLWGALTTLKFIIILFAGNLVIMTTKPKEIILALNKLGVPIKLTFVAITALRFIPILMEELYVTRNAQRARGLRFSILDLRGTFNALQGILSTLIINSVRRARILALAMETRAFGSNTKKVTYKELKMTRLDIALTAVICIITIILLILILIHTFAGYTI